MAESRVKLTNQEYGLLVSKAIVFDVLRDGIISQEQIDAAYARIRDAAGEPVLESTVNTPLIGDPTD